MTTVDPELIKARRQDIRDSAPCVGCGSTLSSCKASRGKDPTAPEWFGCCARGALLAPCHHLPDQTALTALLDEIESGHVRSREEVLLDSITEWGSAVRYLSRRLGGVGIDTWTDPETDYYGD